MIHPKDILNKHEVDLIKKCCQIFSSDKLLVEDFQGERIIYTLPTFWAISNNTKEFN